MDSIATGTLTEQKTADCCGMSRDTTDVVSQRNRMWILAIVGFFALAIFLPMWDLIGIVQ